MSGLHKSRHCFDKLDPATGEVLEAVIQSLEGDVLSAIDSARKSQEYWARVPVKDRGEILAKAASIMDDCADLARVVALESGKPVPHAVSEVSAAIDCIRFFANESLNFIPESLSSSNPNRTTVLLRKPVGIGALIVPFNNPAASIAWKLAPALLCGNAVIIKSHELTPSIAIYFAEIFRRAGLPDGILSVIQGKGSTAGEILIGNNDIDFVSFTGSVTAGQSILEVCAKRMARVCVESGGKNAFVVLEDADLDKAVHWAVKSAFVDAGQRCAAASRMIIEKGVYEEFKKRFIDSVSKLKVGITEECDFGAIISKERMDRILSEIASVKESGATLLCGGEKLGACQELGRGKNGFFISPTVLEDVHPEDDFAQKEIFGPAVAIFKANDFTHAVNLANSTKFGLASAVHTRNFDIAGKFRDFHKAGVIRVNGPTFGSEPHWPFGGEKLSGNGWREPGVQALDFYSSLTQFSIDR